MTAPVHAWFHCFSGISGDMALGSLIDAGADADEVGGLIRRLPATGWTLETKPVLRAGLAATQVLVHVNDDIVVRTHAHIVGLVEEARLPDRVRRRALAAFGALAEAEGRLHHRPTSQVHFHEVGGHDAIVDIVGTCAALEVLDVEVVTSSAVTMGSGMVRTSHGILPNPAPAVLEILRNAPVQGRDVPVELTTPTGAAILAGTVSSYGPIPAMAVSATGFGAGTHDVEDVPNCTQVVIGAPLPSPDGVGPDGTDGHPALLLEANIDDATGEVLAHAVAALLDAGAHDAWVTPVLMKKGRPGHVLSVLADPVLAASMVDLLRSETGSIGARGQLVRRWPAPREVHAVDVDGLAVRVKVSPGRVKAEQADAQRVARRRGLPLREVTWRAEAAWRESHPDGDGPPDPGPVPPGVAG